MRIGPVVCLILFLAAAMTILATGASVEAQDRDTSRTEKTGDAVVGASVVHATSWLAERERYTYDGTYGFTLWRSEAEASHDHGGTPALRVALAYGLEPAEIEGEVQDRISFYEPDLALRRETVSVAEKGYEGVAVGPIPGSTPSTEVYVPVNGRVYRINVYAERRGEEGLDADDRWLLSSVRFESPTRPVESLGLPRANAPETLYASGGPDTAELQRAPQGEIPATTSVSGAGRRSGDDRIQEGCWRADSRYYFRVQYDGNANDKDGDHIRTGFSIVGMPNYWDEYTHGNLDYGRCTERVWANDKFAVDYPLNRGDAVYAPFESGTVTFAGRNSTHRDYGILVTIKASNGKYVSLSAHLDSLARGIDRGTKVDSGTVIGYAGDSGGSSAIPVGKPHLHQAFYRHPSYNADGSPYGGAGLQVTRLRYSRGVGGSHNFGWDKRSRRTKSKGDLLGY